MPLRPRNVPPLTRRGSIFSFSTRKPPRGQQRAEPRQPGARHGGLEILADLPGGAFRRLQGDVAGKALDDDDVDHALADLVALDEAAIVERQLGALQPGVRLAHLLGALDLLDADVEQRRRSAARRGTARAPWRRPSARNRRAGARVAPMLAPTSSTMHSALTVGHSAAIAGRSMPAMGRRISFDMAISAPVLPAETATSASPFCTASSASHMLVPLPRRSAWLGLSFMATTSVGVDDARLGGERGMLVELGAMRASSPKKMKLSAGWRSSEMRGARHDDLGAVIAAHGVERYCPRLRHVAARLAVIAANGGSAAIAACATP